MTEERNDVIEIKKDFLKQFFTIVGASFIGCFLAILLAGQLLKPKAPECHFHRMCPPPPCCMKVHDGCIHRHFAHKPHFKGDWQKKHFMQKALEQKQLQDTQNSVNKVK